MFTNICDGQFSSNSITVDVNACDDAKHCQKQYFDHEINDWRGGVIFRKEKYVILIHHIFQSQNADHK